MRAAYQLASEGKLELLCEALLTAEATAIPVAQALASTPRSAATQTSFVRVFHRLLSQLQGGGLGDERATEDSAFVLGELTLSLRPAEIPGDAELLRCAVGALCHRIDAAGEAGEDATYLIRRAAVDALRHCATTSLQSTDAQEEGEGDTVAQQAVEAMLHAAKQDQNGSVSVYAALGLAVVSRAAAAASGDAAGRVRQLLIQGEADGTDDRGGLSNFEGPKSYSQVVAAELARVATEKPRPALTDFFLELTGGIAGGAGAGAAAGEPVVPFATKF